MSYNFILSQIIHTFKMKEKKITHLYIYFHLISQFFTIFLHIYSIILFSSLSLSLYSTDPPQVTLSLGSTLNPDDIKEGADVYFECHIKANPKEHRITWSHDVSQFLSFDYIFILFYFFVVIMLLHGFIFRKRKII